MQPARLSFVICRASLHAWYPPGGAVTNPARQGDRLAVYRQVPRPYAQIAVEARAEDGYARLRGYNDIGRPGEGAATGGRAAAARPEFCTPAAVGKDKARIT
jgi:hypothetical protein